MATTRPLVIAAIAVRDRKVSDGAVKKSMHDNTSENTSENTCFTVISLDGIRWCEGIGT